MAIIPGTKDFKVVRRSDFDMRLTVKDSTSSAVNFLDILLQGRFIIKIDLQNMQIGQLLILIELMEL